jgi:type I restriction enzyme, S subunit
MAYLKELVNKPISGEWGSDGKGIKVLRTTNFTNKGILNFDSVVTRDISAKIIEQKKLQKGDLIIEKSGGSPTQPVGRVVYFDEDGDFVCNNFTSILRPKKEKVFPKYLHHMLFANHKFGRTKMFQNKTTGIINLQLTRYLEKSHIPLPPLEIQKKIAQILDDATALQNKTEQLIKEYDVLAQSIFFDMFGDLVNNQKKWNLVRFGDVFKSIIYGTSTPPIYQNEGIPFIRATNIKKGGVSKKGMVYISEEEASKILKCKLSESDLIIVRSGANTGDCGRIPEKYIDSYGGFDLIIKIEEPHSVFCNFLLNTKAAKAKLDPLTRRAGQPHLNSKQISEFQILNPPIELKHQFSEKLGLIEKQKELAKQELKESQDLFNCLLQKAFKGELI